MGMKKKQKERELKRTELVRSYSGQYPTKRKHLLYLSIMNVGCRNATNLIVTAT